MGLFLSRDQASGYLAAMIDGEGCIGHYRRPWVTRSVRITNTDREIIDACSEACLLLGIAHKVDTGRKLKSGKTSWTLAIHRLEALQLVADLPIRSLRKRAILSDALASASPSSKRPSREVLEHLYVFEGKSAVEIGRLLGVSSKPVRKWIYAEGFPLHSRSEAARQGHGTRVSRRGTRATGPR